MKTGQATIGAQGRPLQRSGNFADVYQIHGKDGRNWAVKCFTRPVIGLADRYAKVEQSLEKAGLPFTVGFTFLAEGIRIGGNWFPALKMEWVDGLLLHQVVRDQVANPKVLDALLQMWSRLAKRLRETKVAHADLQHGNILLVPGSRPGAYGLKLIDYDGMYVPSLANKPSGEAGHPNYQHPTRAETRAYSPDLDRFPHLVIATALKGLAVLGATLWERFDTGDNLLFVEDDFREPANSPLLRTLWDSGDLGLQSLVGRLAVACTKPIPQTPWLDQIAPDGQPVPLDAQTTQAAFAALGRSAPAVAGGPVNPVQPTPTAGAEAFAGLGDEPQARPPKGSRRLGTRALEPESFDPEPATAARKTGTRKIGTRTQEPHKGKKSSARLIAAVVGLVALGGAGVGGYFLFGGGKKPVETADASKPDDAKPDRPNPPVTNTPVNTPATKSAPTPKAPGKTPPTPPTDPPPPNDAPQLQAPGEMPQPNADPKPVDPLELKPR